MEAHADTTSAYPKRLVLFFTPHGFTRGAWEPSGQGPAASYHLGAEMQNLAPMQRKIVLPQGIDRLPQNLLEGHLGGSNMCWTGSEVNPGPSVDQIVVNSLNPPTLFKSLQLGITSSINYAPTPIFSGVNQPLLPECDSLAAFNQIFTPPSAAQVSKTVSIAGQLKAEIAQIRARISSADYVKMDAHLTAVNDLQKRVQAQQPACFATPTLNPTIKLNAYNGYPNTPGLFQNQIGNLVAALTCDLTRVASLTCHGVVSSETYPWLPTPLSEGHHGVTHETQTPQFAAMLTGVHQFFTSMFNQLLTQMDAIPEGNGTLLDNSLVVWASEYSDAPTHSPNNMPYVLAGTAGGTVVTGQSLMLADVPHTRLLCTIAAAMGVPIETIGNQDPSSGVLSELLV